jgi:PAS domain S-box-containing protein
MEAEAARREAAEATLRHVLESTTDAYVGFDRDWRIVYLNAQAGAAFEAYGMKPARLPGRTIWEVWPDAVGTALEGELKRVMTERVRATFEYLHPASGRWYELHAYPMAEGAAVFFRDVTDRLLTQRQLEQAQRMDAVGELAGGVAHEVNNQMTVVLGASSFLLRRPDLPDWAKDELEYIREAAHRSAAITGQLLAFGRRQMLRPEPLDLNAVVDDLGPILRRAVGPSIEVQLALALERLSVLADRGKVEQALLNLTFNARDAMPQGGVLCFETGRVDLQPGNRLDNGAEAPPGPYAVLRVRDSGVGMDQATLARAFEPFFTTKPVGQGTGLGLSTVYGIVRQSGGYVAAESIPGEGSAFTIYLPGAAVPADRPPVVSGEHALVVMPSGSRGVALVVEDEESVRRMVGRVLVEEGYDVVEAADGASALEAIERLRIDGTVRLVVTDLAMPVMGGRELARRIAEAHPHVPVLYMSGYTDDEVARRGLLGEDEDFLAKPFSPGALARHVRELVGQDSPARN